MKSPFRNNKVRKFGFQPNAALNDALNDAMMKSMTQMAINAIYSTAIRLSFVANDKQNGESRTPQQQPGCLTAAATAIAK